MPVVHPRRADGAEPPQSIVYGALYRPRVILSSDIFFLTPRVHLLAPPTPLQHFHHGSKIFSRA